MKTFKKILSEWPYAIHKEKTFDFEVEKYKTFNDFVTKLKYLTSGIEVVDKYGNVFKTATHKGKEKFKKSMIEDDLLILSVTNQFNVSEDKVIKTIKQL